MLLIITKYVSLSNRKYKIQPTIINLHPNEYSQELHYYPFAIKLDKYIGSCKTFNDLSNKVCVQNAIEDLNIHVFDIITGKNESKISTKDISRECKHKFDGRKCNSNQNWNNDKCRCECKKHNVHDKDYIWNPAIYSCENGKYLASITDDSVIMCDEIKQEAKTIPTNFNEKM